MVKRIERIGKRSWTSMVAGLLTALIAGCPGAVVDGGGNGDGNDGGPVEDGNRDPSLISPFGKTSGEPNDTFAEAIVAVFDTERVARLQGTISTMDDVDVFLIGSLQPEDRVIVDLRATDSIAPLDATLALYDDDGNLVANNDNRRETPPMDLNPYIDWTTLQAGTRYTLVVTHSGLAAGDALTGAYTADVTIDGGEPNDTFAEAIVVVFNAGDVARLQGTVSGEGDIDVYLIGSLDPGDRVIADLRATDAVTPLDATLALFDDDGRLVFDNDDRRSTSPIDLDPYIDWTTRHAGASYKLVVSHSGLAASDGFTGAYTADVTIERGGITPAPVAQIVLLNFSGGEVTVAGDGPMVLAPFDAGAIASIYDGQTDALKTKIRDVFVEKYARFDVTVLTSDDPPPATGTTFTTVHFGGFNNGAYGIADDVDLLNLNCCDDAVIFTETFFPAQFASLPTVDGMGVAIGNVAAHECGHLLGLNHVNDDTDLMDAVSPPDALLLQQEFADSPLSEQIVPIGTQDSALLLFEAVGEAP